MAALDCLALIPERRPGSQYTREQILAAATEWAISGNAERVAAKHGMPPRTLQDWCRQEWWDALVAAIRADQSQALDGMLSGVLHGAVAAVADRLEHGECVLDKDGQTRRVPVKARDAMLIAAISFDKRQIARSLPTSITDTKGGKLGMLRDQLAQVSGRTIEGEARTVPDAHTAPTDAS